MAIPSCQLLGWEYEQGSRVPLGLDRAQRLYARDDYRRACQGGAAVGCTSLKRLDGRLR